MVEKALDENQWKKPEPTQFSTSLSRALHRLQHDPGSGFDFKPMADGSQSFQLNLGKYQETQSFSHVMYEEI